MSDQEQDSTPAMQELMARIACLQAELNSLKERAQALPLPVPGQPSPTSTSTACTSTPTSTRRRALRRLAGGLLMGLAAGGAGFTTGSGESQARTSVHPADTNNQVGAFIVPPGQPLPAGVPALGKRFGLIVTDGSSLRVSNLPSSLIYDTGVLGSTVYGNGVSGYASGAAGFGVFGYSSASSGGIGVVGYASGTSSKGVFGIGDSAGTYAGYFTGDVHLTGTLTGGTKSFKIDHPLDPANKYLYHTSVESPDMINIYTGIVVLDDQGEATVTMPDWFEALNSDYRYQLTCLVEYAPVFVSQELINGQFKIAGGKGGQRVSWMVSGIRQDAYAKAHRTPVEQTKTGEEKGKYIHPELFGQPEEKAIDAVRPR